MNKKRFSMLAGVAVVLIVIVLLLLLPGREKPAAEVVVHEPQSTTQNQPLLRPQLALIERRENGDMIDIVTTYGTLSFPYAFSDLLAQEIVDSNGRIAIDFYAALGGSKYPVYTLSFTEDGDIPLGELQVDDVTFEVTAKFHEDTAGLEGDHIVSFRAAQETFNDIWLSLEANENFTSAQ